MTANVFDEMENFWAEIADKNQTERQIQFLKSLLKPDGYVLDLACGTGRHAIPLSQQGYSMVGLDVSANLLKIAKQRSKEIQLVRSDMRFLPFKPQAFRAVISMDTSFGYLPSKADDTASLAEVRRVVSKQGTFVVDVFNPEEIFQKNQEKNHSSNWKEYPSFFLQQKRTLSRQSDRLCDSWTIRNKLNGQLLFFEHSVRLFKQDCLRSLLEKADFCVKQFYGDYEGQNFSEVSSRLILVAIAI